MKTPVKSLSRRWARNVTPQKAKEQSEIVCDHISYYSHHRYVAGFKSGSLGSNGYDAMTVMVIVSYP